MAIVEPDLLTPDIIEVYQSNITAIKHQMGRKVDIIWDESLSGCPNCFYDGTLNASKGIYRSGGPVPFINGKTCPFCVGKGKIAQTGMVSLSGNIFYPGLFSHDKMAEPGATFDDQSANVSFLISECYCQSGQFAGKLYFDFYKYLEFDNQRWILDGMPMRSGLGNDPFVIEVKLRHSNKK